MGSGLGLICDKTHRVLSSLVGIRSKYLSKIKSKLSIKYFDFLKTTVCFAGVSHGAMLSWPAEVLPQVKISKEPKGCKSSAFVIKLI